MKLRNLLPACLMALPLLAAARPASPYPVKMTNPDGTTVDIIIKGDEYFHFYTDADSKYIMEQDLSGKWVIATRNGVKLPFDNVSVQALMDEMPKYEPLTRGASSPNRMAPLTEEGRTKFPTTAGEVHSLVVLLEYADTPFSVPDPQKAFDKMCNEVGYKEFGAQGSAADFYKANSLGKFSPVFDVMGPVKLSHDKEWYVGAGTSLSGAGKNARFGYAIEESLKYLDAQGVDFSKYDLDGDGDIDNIYFFYSGHGQADSSDKLSIWPHQADFSRYLKTVSNSIGLDPLYLDGKRVGPYACSNELIGTPPRGEKQPWLDGIGAFCHEFGHVLGFPDLYDTNNGNTKTPGKWDLMDSGSYNQDSTCPPALSAWERWTCGWLEYEDLEEGSVNSIQSLTTSDTPKAYRLRIQRPASSRFYNEYFVFECRSNDGNDKSLPDEGMMIWRIDWDHSKWVNNSVNTNGRPSVEIMYSDGRMEHVWPGPYEDNVLSYPGAENEIKPYSNNNRFKPYITDIKYDYDTKIASFEYNVITEKPDMPMNLHEITEFDENKRQFTLTWDPVEDTEKYLLTVTREDGEGNVYKVDGLEETDMALNTSRVVKNISEIAWDQTFTAYVRAFKKVPAGNTSNVLTFVPSKLATGEAGVADIVLDAELPVIGGKGCIFAPEGSQIYNINGIATGNDNLPAGIYIVRLGDKTKKVVVK